ncbi:hypothetical protein GCM10009526_26050 [Glutamicibacter creatinolyticus]
MGGNYCTSGAYTLSQVGSVHAVSSDGVIADEATGTFRDESLDALAVSRTGTHAYAASLADRMATIQRLSGQAGVSEHLASVGVPFRELTGGVVNTENTLYYFGGYVRDDATTYFELFAYDIANDEMLGQVGRIKMPAAASAAGVGDLVIDARGDLLLLWSNEAGVGGLLASVAAAQLPSSAGMREITAETVTPVQAINGMQLNGLALGSLGTLFIQGTDGADTTIATLNRSSGRLDAAVTKQGFAGSDLASCGVATSLVLEKNVASRVQSGDQFKFDIRAAGSTNDLASATTSGNASGAQDKAAGPVGVTVGSVYTIGESGENGASLGDYETAYRCTWAGQSGEPFASGTLSYNNRTGRAQRSLPAIPEANEGMALNCVITNTPKPQLQPKLVLRKNVQARSNSRDQFTLDIQPSGQTRVLATATTSGTATGAQPAVAGPVVAEIGRNYTISERMAEGSVSSMSAYTVTYECRWSQDNTLFSKGALSLGSNGRMQAMLPAIPGDHSGQSLGCTMDNRVKAANGLICTPGTVYAVNNSKNGVHEVAASGVGSSRFTVPSGVSNALAINLDGTMAFAAGGSDTNLNIAKWEAGEAAATPVQGLRRSLDQNGSTIPASPVAGAVDPTTGIYFFGAYSAGTPAKLNVYAYAGGTTYWQAGSFSVPSSYSVQLNNGDLTFDAQGNLYMVWSPGGTGARNDNTVLARLDAKELPRSMPTSITVNSEAVKLSTLSGATSQVFNGIAFDSNGELFVSHSGGYKRLNPATGAGIGKQVAQENLVDLASCGLPPTMTLQKDIADRTAASDQFSLGIYAEGRSDAVQSFTTTGTSTGVQPQTAGPAVVTVGQQYTIRESASGSTNLDAYISSYTCRWSDSDTVFAEGVLNPSGASRQATLPAVPAGKGGQALSCTIVNEPVFDTTVMVRKTLLDVRGQNPAPGAGWEISAEISGGTGGASFPSDQGDTTTKRTVASGSLGSPWGIFYPSSRTTTNLRITETQQAGYELAGGQCEITSAIGAVRTVDINSETVNITDLGPGNSVECEFQNKPIAGSVAWQKVDEGTGEQQHHLSGSEWTLSGPAVPTGTVVTDCTTEPCAAEPFGDRDPRPGYLEVAELERGNYTLVEQQAPAGYVRDQSPHPFRITVQQPRHEFSEPFVNRKQVIPALPFTGGLSSDMFLLGGGGLGAAALGALWYFLRKQRRSEQP